MHNYFAAWEMAIMSFMKTECPDQHVYLRSLIRAFSGPEIQYLYRTCEALTEKKELHGCTDILWILRLQDGISSHDTALWYFFFFFF